MNVEFTDKKISPWGGIHLFKELYSRLNLREFLGSLPLPSKGSNRSIDPRDIIESFMVSVILGSRRLSHSGMLRMDEVIREIFAWKHGAPSASTLSRFFKKWDKDRNDEVFPQLQKKIFEHVKVSKMTIDVDSTIITRHGHQELAHRGYNPKNKGKGSHHPLLAFCDEMKMVINSWMRSGNSNDSTDILGFLEETFRIVDRKRIGLLRMDSGFYNQQIMSKLENGPDHINYVIKARLTSRLHEQICELKNWHGSKDAHSDYQYSELVYTGSKWSQPRRMVVCRKKKVDRASQPQDGILFKDLELAESYEYNAFVTNLTLGCQDVHELYQKRGDCENLIKELKYDYSIEGFALQDFYAMEAAFRFTMVAYNIMVMFRKKALVSKYKHRLSTMRFQCIALGSYVVKKGRNKTLKLSAKGERRHFLERIFDKVELIPPDFQVSNA